MVRSLLGTAALAAVSFAPSSFAATCPGDAGYVLKIAPTNVPIGTSFDVTITAPVGNLVVLLVSTSPGPSSTPYGNLCVGIPASTFSFIQPCPTITFPHPIDCIKDYVGLKGYLQFVSANPALGASTAKKSNSVEVNLINGSCGNDPLDPGDCVTYTQGGWGSKCDNGGWGGGNGGCGNGGGNGYGGGNGGGNGGCGNGGGNGWGYSGGGGGCGGGGGGWGGGNGGCDDDNDDDSKGNPGCLRDKYFDKAFPKDLIIGDPDGWDWDNARAAVFSDANAIEDFLPAGGKAGTLCKNYYNPDDTSSGVFGGQLVAAKLNVGFDEAGVFDSMKNDPSLKLADLVFIANVHPKLVGKTVNEVILLSDTAISGAASLPLDVDGDKVGDINLADLVDALDELNRNFDEGKQALGSLGKSKP